MRTPWIFEDVHAAEIYELEINPNQASMPSLEKTLTPTPTIRGRSNLFQGRDRPKQISLSGMLLTQEQYEALRSWTQKEKQIKVTDDLGRVYWVFFKQFSPRRNYSVQYPWRHEFSISGVVVSWAA